MNSKRWLFYFLMPLLPFSLFSQNLPCFELESCDLGNGQAEFDLRLLEDCILDEYDSNDGRVEWYTDFDFQNQIPSNMIDIFITNEPIIFARVFSLLYPEPDGSTPIPIDLIIRPLPDISIIGDFEICADETTILDGVVINNEYSYTYLWLVPENGGQLVDTLEENPITLNALNEGTVVLEVTDDLGCKSTISQDLEVSENIEVECRIKRLVSTSGELDGLVEVEISNGIPLFDYEWMGPTSGMNTDVVGMPASDFPVTNGTYTVEVTDEFGCKGYCEITVSVCDLLIDNEESTVEDVLCHGNETGTINVVTTGGTEDYIYEWSDLSLANTANQSGLASGVYTVTITDQFECEAIQTFEITQPDPLVVVCTPTNPINENLENGSIELDISGGTGTYEINWGSGNIDDVASNHTIDNLGNGVYNITITDENGCDTTIMKELEGPACTLEVSSQSTHILCEGESTGGINLNIQGAVGDVTINWDDDTFDGMAEVNGLPAGTYSVTITDIIQCKDILAIEITEPSPLVVNCTNPIATTTIGGMEGSFDVEISGGTGPYDIEYAGPISGARVDVDQGITTIFDLAAGTYSVNIFDANGCEISCDESIAIEEPDCTDLVLDNIIVDSLICFAANNGSISFNVSGVVGTVDIDWANDDYDGSDVITDLSVGTYFVTVTDTGTACSIDSFFVIEELPELAVNCTAIDVTTDGGNDGQIILGISNGTPPFQIFLNGTELTTTNTSAYTISMLSEGTYDVQVIDANGCEANCVNGLVNINEPECQGFEINTLEINPASCFGDSDGAFTFNLTDGVFTIIDSIKVLENGMLMDPTPLIVESEPDTFRVSGLMAGIYSVSITDDRGCSSNIDFTIDQPDLLVIQGCMPLMDGENISLTIVGGNGGYSYSITNEIGDIYQNGGTGASLNLSNLQIGINTVTITDTLGCTISCVIPVSDEDCLLEIDITGNDVSCAGENDGSAAIVITQAGTPPYVFEWSNGATTSSLNNIPAGSYSVTVTESDNPDCFDTASIDIEQPSYPNLITQDTVELCPNDEELINAVSNYETILWSTGETTSSIIVSSPGEYGVTITNNDGCIYTDNVEVIGVDITAWPIADSGMDTIIMQDFYELEGNNVDGIIKQWTSLNSDVIIENDTLYNTMVENLAFCENIFVWNFGTEQCPNYDADEVIVYNIVGANSSFNLQDDIVNISPNETTVEIPILNNDLGLEFLDPDSILIEFNLANSSSQVDLGIFNIALVNLPLGIARDTFQYIVINPDCDILRDTADVIIRRIRPRNNAFTPNEDGINDFFEFPEIDGINGVEFFVYNRWNQLVYYSADYQNDWDGRRSGTNKKLANGTYAFILSSSKLGIKRTGYVTIVNKKD